MTSPSAPALPNVIGTLDISGRMIGWARWSFNPSGDNIFEHGFVDLQELVANGTEDPWCRVDQFSYWLTGWLRDRPLDLLVVEQPHGRKSGASSMQIMNGVYTICRLASLRLQIMFRDVVRSEVVKSCLGWCLRKNPDTGEMEGPDKQLIIDRVNAIHGTRIASPDEADAVATLDLILAEIKGTGQVRQTQAEKAIVKRNHKAAVKKRKAVRAAVKAKEPPLPGMLQGKRDDIPPQPLEARKAELARKTPAAIAWPGLGRGVVARGRRRVNP